MSIRQTHITQLKLINFRNHTDLSIKTNQSSTFLIGENGTGKTSVLEAISMFSPIRSMINATIAEQIKNDDISSRIKNFYSNLSSETEDKQSDTFEPIENSVINQGITGGYAIQAILDESIEMKLETNKGNRNIKINGKNIKKNTDLSLWCDIIWFTAVMQRDLHSSTYRRRFFDRLSFYVHRNHAEFVSKYEKIARERLTALEQNSSSNAWLSVIEKQLASFAVEIASNRIATANFINKISKEKPDILPMVTIRILGDVEQMIINGMTKESVEAATCEKLRQNRNQDANGYGHFGTHKTKILIETSSGISFEYLSSGQQKMLFLALIDTVAEVISITHSRRPIILFDEMVSFLDLKNLERLLKRLPSISSQTWITSPIKPQCINLEEMQIEYIELK